MSSLNLRERVKGVFFIVIIVTTGCWTYPPILAFMIVGVCAGETEARRVEEKEEEGPGGKAEVMHPDINLSPLSSRLFVMEFELY